MQHYLFLFLAFAATNTLANPGNGYPYAAPHPDFKKRALEKRDANGKRDVNAVHQVHQAEYKAFMNTPSNLDQATTAQTQQYEQLRAEAEAKAQAAKQYNINWAHHVQQAANNNKANGPNADCAGLSILGTCVTADSIKSLSDAANAAAPAATPDPPPPLAYFQSLYGALGYPYVGGYSPYGYPPYYGGGYPYSSLYGSPYGGYPFGGVPAGYPKPGKGKTSCGDVKNKGYVCNEAFNQLSYCFSNAYPYYFGFGGQAGEGTGSITVAKCCYFGTCAAADDGTIGYCACSGAGTNS